MNAVRIAPLTPERFDDFFQLICALAEYERLVPPDHDAHQRLFRDCFEHSPPRYSALLAYLGDALCGYCIFFETYSSFRAASTLFLEDIFVLPQWRGQGVGRALMQYLACVAMERGCGRMEWLVLDWNEAAHSFYRALGARCLSQWQLYRLDDVEFARLANEAL
ncbi:MAG: GNAT family N-acetyltransferase [Chlorobi bacterium]|nr:GNAT family N-acetyltransferase [Chlorobiota bacterium]